MCSNTTVEEQLADLTELLHTALNSDDENGDDSKGGKDKKPGKLNQELLDNLEHLAEENLCKSPGKGSSYKPIDLVVATQQHKNSNEKLGEIGGFSVSKNTFEYERSGDFQFVRPSSERPGNYQTESCDRSQDHLSGSYERLDQFQSGLASLLLRDLKGEKEPSELSPRSTNPSSLTSNTLHTTVTISSRHTNSSSPRDTGNLIIFP